MIVRRALAEAIGTFFLVLVGPGAAMVNAYTAGVITHVGVSLAFAFVVIGVIFSLGHVSGAHINPAVTLAFWSVGRFPARDVTPYVVAQCAGAVAASVLLRSILGAAVAAGATLPAVPLLGAFAIEWVLSFLLMLVIMAVATDDRVAPGFAAIAIGVTVGCGALMSGPLTGGSFNPARSLGPAVAGNVWRGHWIYWVAPITAMVAAAWAYELLRPAGAPKASRTSPTGVEGPIDRI